MAHVVTSNCVDIRFTDCVLVCPVDAFYLTPNQLVIDPDECIDCSACVSECPVEAIYAEDEIPPSEMQYIGINAQMAAELKDQGAQPITEQIDPMPNAEEKKRELGF
jgi:ferredoxin